MLGAPRSAECGTMLAVVAVNKKAQPSDACPMTGREGVIGCCKLFMLGGCCWLQHPTYMPRK